VKRLGEKPTVIEFVADGASIEVAVRPEHRALAAGQAPANSPANRTETSD
jgi:hypothetical protein